MTAKKRFINHDENVIDNINNEQLTSTDEIVTVMNTLHKENQQLKKKIEYLQKLRMEIRDVTIEEAISKIKEMCE
ncbi:MAG: hypothetical protein IKF11_09690 [Methanobrevibacter sp.]|nr:hypothetical protein [Methanobrevibacter sp.]